MRLGLRLVYLLPVKRAVLDRVVLGLIFWNPEANSEQAIRAIPGLANRPRLHRFVSPGIACWYLLFPETACSGYPEEGPK